MNSGKSEETEDEDDDSETSSDSDVEVSSLFIEEIKGDKGEGDSYYGGFMWILSI